MIDQDARARLPIASGFLALALFGVDEIGVEIEDPFGDDPNDRPLDALGRGIEAVVGELLSEPRPSEGGPAALCSV